MIKNQSLSLLSILRKDEITYLGKFLQSPFFTKKKFLYPLFLELRRVEDAGLALTEKSFGKVFPGEAFDRHKWNKALSDFNACIAEFLLFQQVYDDPQLRRIAFTNAIVGRNDEGYFMRNLSKALEDLENAKENSETAHDQFYLMKQLLSYPFYSGSKDLKMPYHTLYHKLDSYYFLSKLQIACSDAGKAHYPRMEGTLEQFRELINQTAHLEKSGTVLLKIYRLLLMLLTDSGSSFEEFFQLLQKHHQEIEREEIEMLVRYGFNYCIRKIRENEKITLNTYLELLLWCNSTGAWEKGLGENTIINHGIVFATTRDSEKVEAFIEQYSKNIHEDRRADVINLIRAYDCFQRHDFHGAWQFISQVKTRKPRIALLVHSLSVRIQYEFFVEKINGQDDVLHFVHNFKSFLKRTKEFSDDFRKSYSNLLWFIQKLTNAKSTANLKTQLKSELGKRPPAVRPWLEQKISGLP